MAILAPFANFYVFQNPIITNVADATAEKIQASIGLFRVGAGCFVVVAALYGIVARELFVLLEPVNWSLSLLAVWFGMAVYAAVFASALIRLWSIPRLLSQSEALKGLETNQLHPRVMLSLDRFRSGRDLALVLFGVHLLVLGYLVFQSGFVPRWLNVLLIIASVGYFVDRFEKLLSLDDNLTVVTFTFVGEVVLTFWLLWKAIQGFGA